MMIKKCNIYFAVSITILCCFLSYRYFVVNKDIPSSVSIDYFSLNQTMEVDDFTIEINSYFLEGPELINDEKIYPLIVKAEIKNTTKQIKNAALFIESNLNIENNIFQTNEGNFNREQIKNIKPNETIHVTLKYPINNIKYIEKNPINLYIPTKFYTKELKEKYNRGIRYGKAFKLL